MFKKIFNWFDRVEDFNRTRLSRYPIIYAFIGGTCMILFWRGIWDVADNFRAEVSGFSLMIISMIVMLLTGIFVTSFIGEQIIISGLKGEKKDIEKTKDELEEEENILSKILTEVQELKKEVSELKK